MTTRTELQQSHLFSHTSHFLCIMQFQWLHAIKKKSKFWKSKTLPESRPVVSCYHVLPHFMKCCGFGILTQIPFRRYAPFLEPILSNNLPAPSLGPTHPCPTTVHTEPFSTFSLQFISSQACSIEYLLLPPRSVLRTLPNRVTSILQNNPYTHLHGGG